MGLGNNINQLFSRQSLDQFPVEMRLSRLEERVQRLEIRTLLLAVIGVQTVMVMILLMVIINLVTNATRLGPALL